MPIFLNENRLVPYYKLEGVVRFKKIDIEALLKEFWVEATNLKGTRKKDKPQFQEAKRAPEVCRGCFKRTDGKVDYLINGFCEICRPRPDLWCKTRREPRSC